MITGSHCHGCRLETSDSASPQRRASPLAVSSYPLTVLNSLSASKRTRRGQRGETRICEIRSREEDCCRSDPWINFSPRSIQL